MHQSSISQQMDYLRLPRFMLLFCVRVIIAKRFDDKKMFLFVVACRAERKHPHAAAIFHLCQLERS